MIGEWNIVIFICFSFIGVVGFAGNLLVILVFRLVKLDRLSHKTVKYSPMNQCLVNLAVIDLLTSIVNPALYMYNHSVNYRDWMFGPVLCRIIPSLTLVLDTMSFAMILVITIERCIVLSCPLKRKLQSKEVHIALFVVFLVSIVNELPVITTIRVNEWAHVTLRCTINSTTLLQSDPTSPQNNTNFTTIRKDSCDVFHHSNMIYNATCYVTSCLAMSYCLPKPTNVYKTWRLVTLLLRDFVFLVVFISSTVLIYRTLHKQETVLRKQSQIKSRKYLKFLIILAVVFSFSHELLVKTTLWNPIKQHTTNI